METRVIDPETLTDRQVDELIYEASRMRAADQDALLADCDRYIAEMRETYRLVNRLRSFLVY